MSGPGGGDRPVRVLRVIARLNVGGPAHHVTLLSARLDPARYETRLVAGRVGPDEASLDRLAQSGSIDFRQIDALGPELRPLADARALLALIREVRRFRPDIVHTHTAKAGLLGRLAARLVLGRRVAVVHTYHGHVLRGYFSPRVTAVYRTLEQLLGRMSTVLVGVSDTTVDELVDLRVAARSRFVTIPIGLDLEPFAAVARRAPDPAGRIDVGGAPDPAASAGVRQAVHAGPDSLVLAFVGRLVPVKRVDLLVDALAMVRDRGVDARLAIVGDGELRGELEARAAAADLGDAIAFLGFRSDLPAIAAETDVAVLSSDNEGTPVALIEAAAAGVPAITTAAGGVADIVDHGCTGWIVPCGDAEALAGAIADAASHRAELPARGAAARAHVLARYGVDRLVADVDALYTTILQDTRRPATTGPRRATASWTSDRVGRLVPGRRGS